MRRRILAASAVLLLASAVVIWLCCPSAEVMLACCWRGGAILAAAWLAFDDVQRLPTWVLLTLPAVVVVLVRWPRMLILLIPVLIVWSIVQPLLRRGKEKNR